MRILEFIKKALGVTPKMIENESIQSLKNIDDERIIKDRKNLKGIDFEFLIVGQIEVFSDFDNIMTPNTFEWTKTTKNNLNFYQVGADEFSYSFEEPGIQMTFNKEIHFDKAKKIGDEIITNINATGQNAELIILDLIKVYRFE
jgi:hypothetical protein